MIVQGGATLSQRVADGSVARALSGGTYTALVLQERGGDFMCSFGPDSCVQAREALKQLAELGRSKGVKVVLLGTYQPDAMASRKLVETESQAASEANIPYVEVSEKLQRLRREHPQLTWLASDGMHPGKDLALLNGVLIYRELHGAMPRVQPLSVDAPIYGSTSGLKASVRASNAPPPRSDTPMGVQYSSAVVSALLGSLVPSGGS